MEKELTEIYKIADISMGELNQKQLKYIDKIFRILIKSRSFRDDPIEILTPDLKAIADEIKEDPAFSDYIPEEFHFKTFEPINVSLNS